MKIAILLAAGLICLLMVHPVSTQWNARESPVISRNLPLEPFYAGQTLTNFWTIRYPCTVTKGLPKPRIYWQWFNNGNYGGRIDSSSGDRYFDGKYLVLRNINPNETYQCVAENIYGTALSNKINILESEYMRFDLVREKNPPSVSRQAGESLILTCDYAFPGKPLGTFNWRRNREIIIPDARVYINEEGSLIFSYVKPNDASTYDCQNYNSIKKITSTGGWTILNVTNSNTMPDNVPIKLLYNTKNGSIAMLGHKFQVQCIYGGKPNPSVNLVGPNVLERKSHTLEISEVKEKDQGTYTCSAQNKYEMTAITKIYIYVKGPPVWVKKLPPVMIVSEGSNVDFICEARKLTGETKKLDRALWMRNGKPLILSYGEERERLSLSLNGNTLSFSDVRKSTDICNFQCSYHNEYGEIFADMSFNVILKIEILEAPKSQIIVRGDVALLHIKFKVDPLVTESTKYLWRLNGYKIENDLSDVRELDRETLMVNTSLMDEDRFKKFLGNYTVEIYNGVQFVVKYALLQQDPEAIGTTMHSAGLDAKWIALIVALVLFFIIFILLLCILFNRQSGDDYSVDKKERKAGHNPEKELADSGFHDLPRTQQFIEHRSNLPGEHYSAGDIPESVFVFSITRYILRNCCNTMSSTPSLLNFFQCSLKRINKSFSLSITSWMIQESSDMFYCEHFTKYFKLTRRKLHPII